MEEILIVLLCLFFNMMLSGAEMAFVTVSKHQLKSQAKNRSARILLKMKQNPERILSVIQIGITLVGAIAAAVGGAGAEESLAPVLVEKFNIAKSSADALSIVIVVLPITYLSVVVGELVPKTVAIRNPLQISLVAAVPLKVGEIILSPIVSILEVSTNFFLKVFRFHGRQEEVAVPEIEMEKLDHQTQQYVHNIVGAHKAKARDIMIPWSQAVLVRKNETIEEVEQKFLKSRHTRLPVLDEAGEIGGVINTKELLTALRFGKTEWHDLIRPVLKFKGAEPLFRIVQKMQQNRTHLAIIYERMDIAGMLTLEDIIEEIIGDVFDEDDDELLKKILAKKHPRYR
jgi:putative hemolysin